MGIMIKNWQHGGSILLCALIMLFISASGDDTSDATIMTREYVIEHGILTEDELYGVDFESMAKYYNLYEGLEDVYIKASHSANDSFRVFLLGWKDIWSFPGFGSFDDYWLSSVDEEQKQKFTKDDIDQIKAIGVYNRVANSDLSMVFDFEQNRAYFWTYYLTTGDEPAITLLTENQIEEVKDLIRVCHVYNWDEVYRSKYDFWSVDSNVEWSMYYMLDDGRVYSHQGSGQIDYDYAPNSYRDLFSSLWAYKYNVE